MKQRNVEDMALAPGEIAINVSHKMDDRTFFRRNLEKYYVLSNVLDYMCYSERISRQKVFSHSDLLEMIKKISFGKIQKDEWISTWLFEMLNMGLIATKGDSESPSYQLTEVGREYYREQTYHSIYSNLLNSKYMRRLSVLAIILSIIAIVLNITL